MSFCLGRGEREDTHAMKHAIDLSTGLSFKIARKVCKPGVTNLVVDGMMATGFSRWMSRD